MDIIKKRKMSILIRGLLLLILATILLSDKLYGQILNDTHTKFLGSAYSFTQDINFELYWNQVTPENGGKWGSVEGARDQMNWSEANAAYNFAKNHGFKFRYHILVWGNQQPGWIEDLETSEQLEEIEEWFAAVAAQYPDIDYLEVVNEPLHDPPDVGDGGYINALGGTDSLYGTGWDWIIKAFELARQYFPDSTKLMMNEYNIVNSSSNTSKYLEIISLLQDRGLIDGIGVQAHAFSTKGASVSTIKSNLDALSSTGLPIQVCEMDVDGIDDDVQLKEYQRIFPLFWQHESVEGITLWGWRHGLWRESEGAYLVDDRGAPRPSLEWLQTYVHSPFAPVLLSPSLGSITERNPLFEWNSSKTANAYRLQISTSNRFNNFVIDTLLTDTLFQADSLEANQRYYWRVNASNDNGESLFSEAKTFLTNDQITGIKQNNILEDELLLYQNYPNPFNPETIISYSIPEQGHVELSVYNSLGQIIDRTVDSEHAPGSYSVTFDAANLSSGIYYYRIKAGKYSEIKKMLLMK